MVCLGNFIWSLNGIIVWLHEFYVSIWALKRDLRIQSPLARSLLQSHAHTHTCEPGPRSARWCTFYALTSCEIIGMREIIIIITTKSSLTNVIVYFVCAKFSHRLNVLQIADIAYMCSLSMKILLIREFLFGSIGQATFA